MTVFPPTPTVGDQVVFSLKTYEWNGSRWISIGAELNASNLVAGTVAVARGGTGSATAPMIGVVTAADAAAARTTLGAAATNHTHTASQLTGDMPDARIVASNVTQHAAQIDVGDLGNVTQAAGLLGAGSGLYWNGSAWAAGALQATSVPSLAASKITSGELPIARGGTGSATAAMVGVITAADAAAARGVLGAQASLTSPVTSPAITGVSTGSVTGVVKCSQAQYDAITPTATVLYIIV